MQKTVLAGVAASVAVRCLSGLLAIAATGSIRSAAAQSPIPILDLPTATATSAERFGTIINVRALPAGRVLVDDGKNHQVKLLNASLVTERVVLDSARDAANTYDNFPLPLISYLADSTLFMSPNKARGAFVIDPNANVTRALAMPRVADAAVARRANADNTGRVIFQAFSPTLRIPALGVVPIIGDSAPLLRADFAARTTDTIAAIARPMIRIDTWNARGNQLSFWLSDPLKAIDEWAILTDGSIAMVRGHDYHIDWIRPDGTRASTAKLPFDWKTMSEVEKQHLIDTVYAQWRPMAASNTLVVTAERSPTPWPRAALSGSADPTAPTHPSFDTTKAVLTDALLTPHVLARMPDKPSVDSISDYYPPMRTGAALADMDNHLWILPTTSKQSKAGELVYDVVNTKGELFERVRVPLGRYIIGFGPGGVVYMAVGSVSTGFVVERSTLRKQ